MFCLNSGLRRPCTLSCQQGSLRMPATPPFDDQVLPALDGSVLGLDLDQVFMFLVIGDTSFEQLQDVRSKSVSCPCISLVGYVFSTLCLGTCFFAAFPMSCSFLLCMGEESRKLYGICACPQSCNLFHTTCPTQGISLQAAALPCLPSQHQ